MNKEISFSVLLAAVATLGLSMGGCSGGSNSTSSDITGVSTGITSTSITSCTTATEGQAAECMPGLGQYPGPTGNYDDVVFQGPATINNTTAAGEFLRLTFGPNALIYPNELTQAEVTVILTATASGPSFQTIISFPDSAFTGITGPTNFTQSTNTATPDEGTMLMQPNTAYSTSASVEIDPGTQVWDGQNFNIIGASLYFNGTLGGTVSLSRVQ